MSEISNKEFLEKHHLEVESPEQAKRYLDLANNHSIKSRIFERRANDLENQIQRKLQPESKVSEVTSLRRQAESEKKASEKYKHYAELELRNPVYGEVANEFGEQTEKNKNDLSKTKEVSDENPERDLAIVENSFQNSDSLTDILNEISSIPPEEMCKKFQLSKEEIAALSETENLFDGEISFDRIIGYKRGSCSGRQIPICN